MVHNNKLRRLTRRCLADADGRDQGAFNRWLASQRPSKTSQQTDLPSSLIPPIDSLIKTDRAQLFVVIDTCSIVTYRCEFIDFVVRLKKLYSKHSCPIKFIISLIVLEELDKCNRSTKSKRFKKKRENEPQQVVAAGDGNNMETDENPSTQIKQEPNSTQPQLSDKLVGISQSKLPSEPPRMFMRFIEEEMRTSEILVSELDPFKTTKLGESEQMFEIINKDDRILECCLRSRRFIESHAHHSETKVVLVTEDNVFKSKATTFRIASYRWHEFRLKFKNFGLEHYIATPLTQPRLSAPIREAEHMVIDPLNESQPFFSGTSGSFVTTRTRKASPKKRAVCNTRLRIAKGTFIKLYKSFDRPPTTEQIAASSFKTVVGGAAQTEAVPTTTVDESIIFVKEVINLK